MVSHIQIAENNNDFYIPLIAFDSKIEMIFYNFLLKHPFETIKCSFECNSIFGTSLI